MKIRIDLTQQDNWLDQTNGIHSNEFFSGQYSPSFTIRVRDASLTFFRELAYAATSAVKNTILLFRTNSCSSLIPQSNRSGLVVFFHGLNGRPSVWSSHLEQYEECNKKGANLDLFTPQLPKLGHCSLDDQEVQLIYEAIKNWIKQNPGKPMVLFGQSNGSRFAVHLEQLLRKDYPNTPVYVSLTGAALYGSSLVTRICEIIKPHLLDKITFGLLSKTTFEQLSSGSNASKELLSNLRKPIGQDVAERRYRMYASPHDTHIHEYGSSLPILSTNNGINEKHYFITGYGHNSLVTSVIDEQIAKTFHWVQKKSQEGFSKKSCPHCLEEKKVVPQKEMKGNTQILDQRTLLNQITDFTRAIFNQIASVFKKISQITQPENHSTAIPNDEKLDQNPSKIDSSPLTPAQALYAEKLKKSTIDITKNVLTFFMDPKIREMTPSELREVFEIAQEDYPLIMDDRTQKFFNNLMLSVNSMVNDLTGMKESFDQLALASGDPDIQNKIVHSIAFGYIKNLMLEFDLEDTSIVDQMIQ